MRMGTVRRERVGWGAARASGVMLEVLRAWLFWLPLILAAAFPCIRPVHAFDHGFDHADQTVQWFDQLQRPDDSDPLHKCCGVGDAYPVRIIEEGGNDPEVADWTAEVTDGSAIAFPDGTQRAEIPNGTIIHFPGTRVTKPQQGNPTKTAWAFLSVNMMHGVSFVWCVVPLPPAM